MLDLLTLDLRRDQDVVLARTRARQVALALGFDTQAQTRIATSVSELVRNAHRYAGGGRVHFAVDDVADGRMLRVSVVDEGPGIAALDDILEGRYRSTTGMGQGLRGARRLSDAFRIETAAGAGTTVEISKRIPRDAPPFGAEQAGDLVRRLRSEGGGDAVAEVERQNQELLQALAELRERQEQVERLNAALEERGADLATHALLADQAREAADDANQGKSRFLAVMSHELKTPLGAILGYARLMQMGIAGAVTPDQEKYLDRIARAQAHLLGLIDDVLAFATLESGRLPLELTSVSLREVCASLETLTEPQLCDRALRYRCADVPAEVTVRADADKVLQILVNLVANAMKFTPAGGTITVGAEVDGAVVRATVADTGRGIPAARLESIFEPFVQVERRLRGPSEGVGLGLAISRELARAMGGDLRVQSTFGEGAAFTLTLPRASD